MFYRYSNKAISRVTDPWSASICDDQQIIAARQNLCELLQPLTLIALEI